MHPALPALALLPLWNGMVTVQDGVSKGGMHWRMSARAEHGRLLRGMSVPGFDGWYDDGPMSARFPLTADRAEDIGDASEELVDGAVYKTVAAVRVETSKRTLVIHPRRAPAKAIRSWRPLKDMRFFAHWLPDGDAPLKVVALDASGKVLAEQTVG